VSPALAALLSELVTVEQWAPGSPYYRGRAGVNLVTAITSATTIADWAIEDRAVIEAILRRHPEALRELLGEVVPEPCPIHGVMGVLVADWGTCPNCREKASQV
jgi:hypothetical protein